MVITMAKLRMAHASMHGARKPPGPRLQQQTIFFLHISSSYANIGETKFHTQEIPQSGSKAKVKYVHQ